MPFNWSYLKAHQLKIHVTNAQNPPKDQKTRFYIYAYLSDAICAQQYFPRMSWTWTSKEIVVNIYCNFISDFSYLGVMARLTDHFIILLYDIIFEQDLPFMSRETMQVIVKIVDWYASHGGTFIEVFWQKETSTYSMKLRYRQSGHVRGLISPLHMVISRTALEEEISWPTLPLRIRLCKIKSLKDAYAKDQEILNFNFGRKVFNLYDPHNICENHCAKVYSPWIHETFQ